MKRVLAGLVLLVIGVGVLVAQERKPGTPAKPAAKADAAKVEPRQSGGESGGIVQGANLVYAGTKTSKCFSDHFLVQAEKTSAISTSGRFHAGGAAERGVGAGRR